MWGGVCCPYQVGRLRGSPAVGLARRWWSCRGSAALRLLYPRRWCRWLGGGGACADLLRLSLTLSGSLWVGVEDLRRVSASALPLSLSLYSILRAALPVPLRLSGALSLCGVYDIGGLSAAVLRLCGGLGRVNPRGAYMLGFHQAYHDLLYIMHNLS